jgi:hypothetical protein
MNAEARLTELYRKRQADVAEADDAESGLSLFDPFDEMGSG